jgi:amino acid transporter
LTDRERGNTEAPSSDVDDRDGAESAPRRVGEVREERETERERDRKRRDAELGTSWVSVILGWLAALGASLILSGIVGAIVGGILGALGLGQQGATSGGIAGFAGVLVTLLLAFLIGGYVAGRMASRYGVKHGLLVPLLALLVTLVLAIVGAVFGASFIDQLAGVTLPGPIQNAAQGIQQTQNLGTILSISGILALLVPFIGGAIGGAWGARTGRDRP